MSGIHADRVKTDHWEPLLRGEVIKAIERNYPCRIPMIQAKWWGEGLVEQYGDRLEALDRYPQDAEFLWIDPLDYDKMGLSWYLELNGAHDSRIVLDDWAKLDEFIEKMPDPEKDPQLQALIPLAEKAHREDRYLLFSWWRLFFERPWGIRGMTNLLLDYHLEAENIHRLYAALCDLYIRYLEVAVREFNPDGFWTSDDLGHQTQLFMKQETFREFLKPYYLRLGNWLKVNDLHWWLHSCGNNTEILPDLIEAGVDVFHPVQKGTMDEVSVARQFGDKITFLAGFDVQHILQEATPEEVRAEVRWLVDTFDRPEGGMCIAAGNGIVKGTPFDNIEAFLDEAVRYGGEHRAKW